MHSYKYTDLNYGKKELFYLLYTCLANNADSVLSRFPSSRSAKKCSEAWKRVDKQTAWCWYRGRWLLCVQFVSLWCHWCRESSYMAVLPDKAAPQRDVAPDIISVIKFSHTADRNIIRSKRWLLCTPRCLLCLLALVCTVISEVLWNDFNLLHRRYSSKIYFTHLQGQCRPGSFSWESLVIKCLPHLQERILLDKSGR